MQNVLIFLPLTWADSGSETFVFFFYIFHSSLTFCLMKYFRSHVQSPWEKQGQWLLGAGPPPLTRTQSRCPMAVQAPHDTLGAARSLQLVPNKWMRSGLVFFEIFIFK